ncbi:MAG TPA: hypothetical protein VF120_17715 [Ktedonobacterales bacterium]
MQVVYARKMAALTGQPLTDALLTQTSFYKLLGLPGDFDVAEPIWQGLIAWLDARADAAEQARAIHGYYLHRLPAIPQFGHERHWGCFAYDWRPARQAIRIHFSNQDAPEPGALSRERMTRRQDELRAMFAVVREERPDAQVVIGGSWLYNLDAYRRLYPPEFGASATPNEPHLQYRALWGQFLRSDWSLNDERAAAFLARVAGLADPARYAECFPLQVLLTQAPIAAFYACYGV